MPPAKKRASDADGKAQAKRRKKQKDDESDGSDIDGAGADFDNEPDEGPADTEFRLESPMLMGELLFCGGTNWDLIGRRVLPKGVKPVGGPNLWGPHRVGALDGVKIRSVASGCNACHCVAITEDGKVYTWGRNEKGQLGVSDTNRRDVPTKVDLLDNFNIVAAACGKNHTLFLTDRGKVLAAGDNKMGQLGIGNQTQNVPCPMQVKYKGPPIRRIACGGEFSMISDINGNLYSFGCPEYGQLGHNTDGKYFVTSNKMEYKCEMTPRKVNVFIEKTRDGHVMPVTDVDVREIACGQNHTLALDSKKRVFSWGFGGYGRLGHAEPKDELVPRLIKFFDGPNRGAVQLQCGSSFSMAVHEHGALYFWGQSKPTGEATMYPKLVQDLAGWKIRSIACCYRSIVLCADDSVVSWGPSPTYGELGYGENKMKSSTVAQEVKPLDGVHVYNIACGYAHTMFLARCDTDEERERLQKLPLFSP
ncbi:protein RCC2-like [Babylonia areolata]|uniref:protein RCC2-like n=1 Tax=Babylonia areolata TaxID=304850 RepID=UPI003FD65D63